MLVRERWHSLNGDWDFALDVPGAWDCPADVTWDRRIRVPFAPEAPLSGVSITAFFRAVWYRCTIPRAVLQPGERWLLHFGAVDYRATVWVDDRLAGEHLGGYTPFTVELAPFLAGADDAVCIVVRAEDDPQDLAKPRGKQDWQLEPHSIWYPRTTGIWQTVWTGARAADVDRPASAGRRISSAGRSGSRR